jgi:hypothetical protein
MLQSPKDRDVQVVSLVNLAVCAFGPLPARTQQDSITPSEEFQVSLQPYLAG